MNAQLDPMALVDAALNRGELGVVEAWATLHELKTRTEQAMGALKESAVDAVGQYGKDGIVVGEYVFVKTNGRRIYDYSGIKAISEKQAEVEALKAEAKAAADAQEKGHGYHDEITGEVVVPALITRASDTITATKKKS